MVHSNVDWSQYGDHTRRALAVVLTHALPSLDAQSDMASEIAAFLECIELWTLEKAAARGLLTLMGRLAEREWSGVGASFRLARCKHGVHQAAKQGNLSVLQWWVSDYLAYAGDLRDVYRVAVYYGHLHVVQWLHANTPFGCWMMKQS